MCKHNECIHGMHIVHRINIHLLSDVLFFLSFCTLNALHIYFVDVWYVSVWKSVCAQPPKWNAAAERDWNQYFLLCHLSHLYKAETIWTPVYSTLASFIKLPHLTKTHTQACTRAQARTHTHTLCCHALKKQHVQTHDTLAIALTLHLKYFPHFPRLAINLQKNWCGSSRKPLGLKRSKVTFDGKHLNWTCVDHVWPLVYLKGDSPKGALIFNAIFCKMCSFCAAQTGKENRTVWTIQARKPKVIVTDCVTELLLLVMIFRLWLIWVPQCWQNRRIYVMLTWNCAIQKMGRHTIKKLCACFNTQCLHTLQELQLWPQKRQLGLDKFTSLIPEGNWVATRLKEDQTNITWYTAAQYGQPSWYHKKWCNKEHFL